MAILGHQLTSLVLGNITQRNPVGALNGLRRMTTGRDGLSAVFPCASNRKYTTLPAVKAARWLKVVCFVQIPQVTRRKRLSVRLTRIRDHSQRRRRGARVESGDVRCLILEVLESRPVLTIGDEGPQY